MSPFKKRLVALTIAALSIALPIFLAAGYSALYWAWLRGNLQRALPYLPWARNFGMLAMIAAAAALGILFSPRAFTISPRTRLLLSLLATATIGFFSEFRNEGKFHLKKLVHFFGPGTWVHDGLNRIASSLGDVLYRLEYSHLNDFLMGPAIVSVLYALVFVKIYGAYRNKGHISLSTSTPEESADLDDALRFARILMNVGLFWFFTQAWAEKAGYLRNPHSNDEIDLPFEFAGTMLGFWMARVLTKPFDQRSEKFRSTFLVDFLASGAFGLIYTLIVGPLTEGVASSVAHGLFPVVPGTLDIHEYTPLQRYMRPLELLFLAGAMWWGLNRSLAGDELIRLHGEHDEPEADSKWNTLILIVKALGVTIGYLLVVATMLSFLKPEGMGWTVATAAAGIGAATAALLVVRRAARHGLTTLFSKQNTSVSS